MPEISRERLEAAYQKSLAALLAERRPEGHWVGELSTSALSTATAIMALALVQQRVPGAGSFDALIQGGLNWLVAHQNADGGWGDTDRSMSNISTTMLCRATFYIAETVSLASGGRKPPDSGAASSGGLRPPLAESLRRAEDWLFQRYGSTPAQLAEAVRARYSKDRTFAVPILTTCALAGLVDWREVPPLPYELACFPQAWFRLLRLHVVSYALPALIAIGQCIYTHRPPWNPFTRFIRWLSRKRSLRVLERIQPSNGGFLEATPLTSFVTLSLAAIGRGDHPVARKGVEFIKQSVRPDGSWPIDTNLSTWVTTLSINALAAAGELEHLDQRREVYLWLKHQQYTELHPYTEAAPGGFSWTPLPGSVPDADDTPGAIIALCNLERSSKRNKDEGGFHLSNDEWWHRWGHARNWLCDLQNSDGGWPTFCRGWGKLPFDRSGTDLTAHAIRAFLMLSGFPFDKAYFDRLYGKTVRQGLGFLARQQRPDGSWLPLWFGNQHAPDDSNPTYGTARVLAAYRDLDMMNSEPARRGVAWLLANQNADGGWGGCLGTPSSMEETALAVEILLDAGPPLTPGPSPPRGEGSSSSPLSPWGRGAGGEGWFSPAVNKSLLWLVQQVEAGGLQNPSPIGFYFAKLWYYEKLYPIIFTVAALGRARKISWTLKHGNRADS